MGIQIVLPHRTILKIKWIHMDKILRKESGMISATEMFTVVVRSFV